MTWVIRELSGGTYTSGTNWADQFDDATPVMTVISSGGELLVPSAASIGRRARALYMTPNPFAVAYAVGSACQVIVNGVIAGEHTGADTGEMSFEKGTNVIDIVTQNGVFDSRTSFTPSPTTSNTTGGLIPIDPQTQ